MKIAYFLLLISLGRAYVVEMETNPQDKTCISEMFKAGEPISVRAKITETAKPRYAAYVTVENESRVLLAHKKIEIDEDSTLLTYNNELDQSLSICVDNFEAFTIIVELDIRFRHHLANLNETPSVDEYAELDTKLDEVSELVARSHSYFEQNEEFIDDVVDQGSYLESSLNFFGILTIVFIMGSGVLQVLLVRHDMQRKKLF